MKNIIIASLLCGLGLASPPVAPPVEYLLPTATPVFTVSDLIRTLPKITPQPKPGEQYADIELRQNLGVDLNAGSAPAAEGQVPPVTTYSLNVQQGSTAVVEEVVYTQTFASVLDQFPRAKSGVIGYGTLQRREAEPTPAPQVTNTGIAGRIRI